jgi:hypothetical protein
MSRAIVHQEFVPAQGVLSFYAVSPAILRDHPCLDQARNVLWRKP